MTLYVNEIIFQSYIASLFIIIFLILKKDDNFADEEILGNIDKK